MLGKNLPFNNTEQYSIQARQDMTENKCWFQAKRYVVTLEQMDL